MSAFNLPGAVLFLSLDTGAEECISAPSWNGFDMLSYEVVQWGKPLEKAERETPEPKGTEVLLKLKYCGVCHSDVHIRDGYFDLGGGKRLPMSERGMNLPADLGP